MDLRTAGTTLMASRVLPGAYILGSLALLVGVTLLLSGPRPRSVMRRTAGTVLSVFGLVLVIPSVILGVAATSTPGPMAPSPTPRPGEELISCTTDGLLPPVPAAPPAGCVLVVEWGEAEQPPLGLLATTGPLPIADAQPGHWWYHPPDAAEQHIEAFRTRYPDLPVQDLR